MLGSPSGDEPRGDLADGVIPGVLRDLYVGRRTGILHFARRQEQHSLRFIEGHIVHGATSREEKHLGETMVRHSLLKQADLARATPLVVSTKLRLGQVLQELAVLDKNGLARAVAIHVGEIIQETLAWTEGTFWFQADDSEVPVYDDVTLTISTGEVILEAVRAVKDPKAISSALGNLDRVVGLSSDPLLRFQRVHLSPEDGFLYSRVDGNLTGREVLALVPGSPFDAERRLLGLFCVGMVEWLGSRERDLSPLELRAAVEDTHATFATRDHYQVLGLERGATPADIRAAFLRLARRFQPDQHHDPSLGDLRDKLNAVFGRIGLAYGTLSAESSGASYERMLSRVRPVASGAGAATAPEATLDPAQQDAAIETARLAGECGERWQVILLLEPLIASLKGRLRGVARLLLAQAFLHNPNWTRRAEEQLRAATEENPDDAEAFYRLGELYRGQGLTARALALYRRAVAIMPRHRAAQAAIETCTLCRASKWPVSADESGGVRNPSTESGQAQTTRSTPSPCFTTRWSG